MCGILQPCVYFLSPTVAPPLRSPGCNTGSRPVPRITSSRLIPVTRLRDWHPSISCRWPLARWHADRAAIRRIQHIEVVFSDASAVSCFRCATCSDLSTCRATRRVSAPWWKKSARTLSTPCASLSRVCWHLSHRRASRWWYPSGATTSPFTPAARC